MRIEPLKRSPGAACPSLRIPGHLGMNAIRKIQPCPLILVVNCSHHLNFRMRKPPSHSCKDGFTVSGSLFPWPAVVVLLFHGDPTAVLRTVAYGVVNAVDGQIVSVTVG